MTAITDEQFDAIIVQLRAMVGALGGIGDAIREQHGKQPTTPPSSRPSSRPRGSR